MDRALKPNQSPRIPPKFALNANSLLKYHKMRKSGLTKNFRKSIQNVFDPFGCYTLYEGKMYYGNTKKSISNITLFENSSP